MCGEDGARLGVRQTPLFPGAAARTSRCRLNAARRRRAAARPRGAPLSSPLDASSSDLSQERVRALERELQQRQAPKPSPAAEAAPAPAQCTPATPPRDVEDALPPWTRLREQGNAAQRAGDSQLAAERYSAALELLQKRASAAAEATLRLPALFSCPPLPQSPTSRRCSRTSWRCTPTAAPRG